ncbi:MAG TPA: DUF1559 domain-containing protein [Thermoguttaceae bacterium]|nr:DUF1559 domain-containing protein [Thermoguttaceae bacterium]
MGWGIAGNGRDAPITRRPDPNKGDKCSGSVSIAHIRDGTSNTILVGEKTLNIGLLGQHQSDDDGGYVDGWDWDIMRWGYFQPIPDWNNPDPNVSHSGYASRRFAFGASHPGGFNVVLCDGSVRPISYSISLDIFKRLCNRKDGQPIDATQF